MRRSDEYRWRQVVIVAAMCWAFGLIGGAIGLYLKSEMAPLPVLIGLFGGPLFGMCAWYSSAWD